MALSAEAIVAIVSLFVALPYAAMTIWTFIKRTNNARLRRRGMAVFLRQVEEEMLSNPATEERYPLAPLPYSRLPSAVLASRQLPGLFASALTAIKAAELASHQ